MLAFQFFPAYTSKKSSNGFHAVGLPISKKQPGVYLIKEDNEIVYIGMSKSSIYDTLYRHFQSWSDQQYRVTYKSKIKTHNYEVAAISTADKTIAAQLEKELIILHQPRDNRVKYENYIAPIQIPTDSFFNLTPNTCPF